MAMNMADRTGSVGRAGGADRAGGVGSTGSTGSDVNRAVYVISVAAELTGVHPQTLRIYERKGLLDPSRTSGGSRRFSDADLSRLRRIQQLTATGLNLEGVRRVIELEAELDETRAQSRAAVAATHRQYRRDLVPLRQSPVAYKR